MRCGGCELTEVAEHVGHFELLLRGSTAAGWMRSGKWAGGNIIPTMTRSSGCGPRYNIPGLLAHPCVSGTAHGSPTKTAITLLLPFALRLAHTKKEICWVVYVLCAVVFFAVCCALERLKGDHAYKVPHALPLRAGPADNAYVCTYPYM